MRNTIMVLLAILFFTVPVMAAADEKADLKKKIFMDKKKLVVLQNMEFTEDEAVKFWPLYEKYQEKIFVSKKQYSKLIASYTSAYKTMTETEALVLIDEYYKIQGDYLALMKQYADDLKVILPGQKVLRYIQVENRLDAVSRFQMANRIPMALETN